jgi:hypothetical protein
LSPRPSPPDRCGGGAVPCGGAADGGADRWTGADGGGAARWTGTEDGVGAARCTGGGVDGGA